MSFDKLKNSTNSDPRKTVSTVVVPNQFPKALIEILPSSPPPSNTLCTAGCLAAAHPVET